MPSSNHVHSCTRMMVGQLIRERPFFGEWRVVAELRSSWGKQLNFLLNFRVRNPKQKFSI